jgi:hypothetical protein
LLEHWSSANFQLTYAKEMANMTSEEGESLHTDSISTSQEAARMVNSLTNYSLFIFSNHNY